MKYLLCISSFLSLSAFAGHMTFLDTLRTSPDADQIQVSTDVACTDFTGHWKGACLVENGKKVDQEFMVAQKGCELVEVKAEKQHIVLPIGGVFSASGAMPKNPAVTFGANVQSFWNTEMTVLNVHVMGGSKALSLNVAPKGFMAMETISMNEGKMFVKTNAFGSGGNTTVLCEFAKQ